MDRGGMNSAVLTQPSTWASAAPAEVSSAAISIGGNNPGTLAEATAGPGRRSAAARPTPDRRAIRAPVLTPVTTSKIGRSPNLLQPTMTPAPNAPFAPPPD